ncbi:hypothetical protein ACVNPZ_06300 [Staphylococcus aureus]
MSYLSPMHQQLLMKLLVFHFYNEQDEVDYQTERSEQLGTLFRKNIYQMIPQEVTPIIPSSLVATYPFNNESPIVTLIKRYQSAASLSDLNHRRNRGLKLIVKHCLVS